MGRWGNGEIGSECRLALNTSHVPRKGSRVPLSDSRLRRSDSRVQCNDSRLRLNDSRLRRKTSRVGRETSRVGLNDSRPIRIDFPWFQCSASENVFVSWCTLIHI